MNLTDYLALERYEYLVLLVDFVIAIVLLTLIGKVSGLVSNVNSVKELSVKDNHAFGISFGAALLALGLMLTGAVSGDETISLVYEVTIVLSYGVFGILLMVAARFILDKISLPQISIHEQILKGNAAAALVDAANMIATAIIIRAVMIWVDAESFMGLALVAFGFIASQILMIIVTRYRTFVYAKRHEGGCIQDAFENGNIALAIRYFGHKVGAALAVTAASGLVTYMPLSAITAALLWVAASAIMVIALSLIAIAARHVVLSGINVVEEVDDQGNIGIGLIEAIIYIVIGLLLVALFAVSAY
ncbi:MAG: DUF350 domain-containing protein [Gammaproteobacteria bacterium]|nr:DUF350 domain-containing protein [Gammaproteobacteria bacterium]